MAGVLIMAAPQDRPGTAATLERLAAALGVPVEHFRVGPGPDQPALVDLLLDPHGARIAQAFRDVSGEADRRALADTVVAIAGTMNLKAARRR